MDRVTFNGIDLAADEHRVEVIDIEPAAPWVPLSARQSRVAMLRWQVRGLRERMALRLAPWLEPYDD
jgi:hypothetical protein